VPAPPALSSPFTQLVLPAPYNNKNRCEGTYTCTREETRERSISRAHATQKKSRHRRAQPHRFTECLLQPCNNSLFASGQSVSALLLGRLIAIAGADLLRSYFIPDYFSRQDQENRSVSSREKAYGRKQQRQKF
jgi:hypothetical protein